MKKILSLFLAALMLVSVVTLVSCGDTKDPATTTAAPAASSDAPAESEETKYTVEQKDYSSYEKFTVYMRSRDVSSYASSYIIYDEASDTGDAVEQAVFNRNNRLEEFYKIKIEFMEATNPTSKLSTDLKADVAYDLVYDQRNQIGNVCLSNVCKNWANLNIDYTKEWWDSNVLRDLSIAGKCFHMTNDISIARFSGARFFYFNKQLVSSNHLKNPYELMQKNEWTLDNFLEMVKAVKCESVGTDTIGTYGLVLEVGSSNGVYIHMTTGMGVEFTSTNTSGDLEFSFSEKTTLDKIDTAYGKIKEVFNDKTCVLTQREAKDADVSGISASTTSIYDSGRLLFADGRFLFTHSSIGVSKMFVEMKDDWGVAPNPKYDSEQENYRHRVDKYTLMFCLPNTELDEAETQYVCDVLNYWAYISLNTVTPAYYEVTIKQKRVQEATAAEVIDLVKSTIRYEVSDLIGSCAVAEVLESAYSGTGISNAWAKYERSYTKILQNITSKIKAIK